jgi:hypothetical protein
MKGWQYMDNSDIQRIRHIKSYCEDIADAVVSNSLKE